MTATALDASPRSVREAITATAAATLAVAVLLAIGRKLARDGPPWLDADIWLTIHLASVVPALTLGAWLLFRRKGDRTHRLLGRLWAAIMAVGALSSFGLTGLMGHLSPIHLLSVLTLIGLAWGARCGVRGEILAHRRTMMWVYTGLVVAGGFAFLPGRLLGSWLWR